MYSPKISEDLVHQLYHIAKVGKMPMTRLVDGILRSALANMKTPKSTATGCSILNVRKSEPQKQAVA